jgi:hypothetical protein
MAQTFRDPLQAIILGATGVVARGFIAGATVLIGMTLASYPDPNVHNVFWLFALPITLNLMLNSIGMACDSVLLIVTWVSILSFIICEHGKWALWLLFSCSFYSVVIKEFHDRAGLEFDQSLLESWHLMTPFLLGLAFALPDLVNFGHRKLGSKPDVPNRRK